MAEINVRVAVPADAEQILAIYEYYIRETTITFEEVVPSVAEFRERIAATLLRYPYLVAERAGNGTGGSGTEIVGYAYASQYKGRVAYDWSAEATVYVSLEHSGEGIGSRLYAELERYLRLQNVVNVAACITTENQGSVAFHRHCGYSTVGTFPHIGFKLARWLDVTWMQKTLGRVPGVPGAFVPFGEL
jgi:phosphinothricin acetyltransferase